MISKFLEHTTYNGLRENALHVHAMQMLLMSLLQHLVLRATEALQAKIALLLVAGLVAIWILIHLHSRHCIRQIGQRNRFLGQNLRRCKTSALFNNTVCLLNRSQNFWHRRKPSYPGLLPVLLLHFAATWWVPEWVVVVHSKES